MANHVRRQVRDAAATALTGLTTTGANVFSSRIYQMQDAELPGLRVFTKNENSEFMAMGAHRTKERRLELVVEACVKKLDTFDDDLDLICKEVEVALGAVQTLGGIAKYVDLKRTEIEFASEGERPVGKATLTYEVYYLTAHDAPDVAL